MIDNLSIAPLFALLVTTVYTAVMASSEVNSRKRLSKYLTFNWNLVAWFYWLMFASIVVASVMCYQYALYKSCGLLALSAVAWYINLHRSLNMLFIMQSEYRKEQRRV